jgi:hypothetical protein
VEQDFARRMIFDELDQPDGANIGMIERIAAYALVLWVGCSACLSLIRSMPCTRVASAHNSPADRCQGISGW